MTEAEQPPVTEIRVAEAPASGGLALGGADAAPRRVTPRVLWGYLDMVDLDPDQHRLRLRTWYGERHTFEAANHLTARLREALGQPVQLRCDETVNPDGTLKCVVAGLFVVSEFAIGPDRSERTWQELAEQQGVDWRNPPEIGPLLDRLFPDSESTAEFREFVNTLRARTDDD